MAKILRIRAREDIIMRMYEANKLLLQQPAVLRVGTAGHFLPGDFFASIRERSCARLVSLSHTREKNLKDGSLARAGINQNVAVARLYDFVNC